MIIGGATMAIKYRIKCMSSERGWGREYWHEDFDNIQEAKKRIYEINSNNTATTVPDYYEVAENKIEAIEETMSPQGYI
jgi:hypothetical protein